MTLKLKLKLGRHGKIYVSKATLNHILERILEGDLPRVSCKGNCNPDVTQAKMNVE